MGDGFEVGQGRVANVLLLREGIDRERCRSDVRGSRPLLRRLPGRGVRGCRAARNRERDRVET